MPGVSLGDDLGGGGGGGGDGVIELTSQKSQFTSLSSPSHSILRTKKEQRTTNLNPVLDLFSLGTMCWKNSARRWADRVFFLLLQSSSLREGSEETTRDALKCLFFFLFVVAARATGNSGRSNNTLLGPACAACTALRRLSSRRRRRRRQCPVRPKLRNSLGVGAREHSDKEQLQGLLQQLVFSRQWVRVQRDFALVKQMGSLGIA